MNWVLICILVTVGGAIVGLINGLLVEFAQIDSFIATLGTGSVLYALSGWITGGGRIVPPFKGLPTSFTNIYDYHLLGMPMAFYYVIILVIILGLILELLPAGRALYVIGSNARAAALVGIPSLGAEYLLPAFVGALLGSTTIRLGRANAMGTFVAVAILAIGVSGIQQLGASFWVTPLFNGLTLLAAVGLAGYSSRRRLKAGSEASRKSMENK